MTQTPSWEVARQGVLLFTLRMRKQTQRGGGAHPRSHCKWCYLQGLIPCLALFSMAASDRRALQAGAGVVSAGKADGFRENCPREQEGNGGWAGRATDNRGRLTWAATRLCLPPQGQGHGDIRGPPNPIPVNRCPWAPPPDPVCPQSSGWLLASPPSYMSIKMNSRDCELETQKLNAVPMGGLFSSFSVLKCGPVNKADSHG